MSLSAQRYSRVRIASVSSAFRELVPRSTRLYERFKTCGNRLVKLFVPCRDMECANKC